MIDLNKIEGIHKLTGVSHYYYGDGYILEIDGSKYLTYESVEDKYRSCCAITLRDEEKIENFPEQEVKIKIGERDDSYSDETLFQILTIRNIEDDTLIFRAETVDWTGWYPYATFEYHPENLPINKLQK